jgi:hypothetical protein
MVQGFQMKPSSCLGCLLLVVGVTSPPRAVTSEYRCWDKVLKGTRDQKLPDSWSGVACTSGVLCVTGTPYVLRGAGYP